MLSILIGLVLLVAGAEALVRGASRLAAMAGIAPLVIGLTVVAFGTSAPEMAVSVSASLDGRAGVAVGNVIGSNIFNVLLILGVSGLIAPLVVSSQLVRFDVPVMIAASVAVLLLSLDGTISRLEGVALAAAMVIYTTLLAVQSRRGNSAVGARQGSFAAQGRFTAESAESAEDGEAAAPAARRRGRYATALVNVALIAGGLALLVIGSRELVDGAVAIAQRFGVSELVIGLTIVAAGTSLPELATSVLAAIRGERDIAVGNIVGSNIFNIAGILGVSAAAGGGVTVAPGALRFDLPVMVAVAVACLPIFATGHRISRAEAGLFLLAYAAYLAYVLLAAAEHDALPAYSTVMLFFVVPLLAIGVGVSVVRARRGKA